MDKDLPSICIICQTPLYTDVAGEREWHVSINFLNTPVHRSCFLSDAPEILARDLKPNHAGQPIALTGTVLQKSGKKFYTTFTKHECPSCGNVLSTLQITNILKEPKRCSCGRKGQFRQVSSNVGEFIDMTIQDDTIQVETFRLPASLSEAKVGDKVKIYGEITFNHQGMRQGGTSAEAFPVIRPMHIEVLEKGNVDDPETTLQNLSDGYEFEHYVARLLDNKGYHTTVTKKSGDGGYDIKAVKNGVTTLVQCKHSLDKTIGRPVIDSLLGVMTSQNAPSGIVVTTGKFSADAIALARSQNIELWDKEIVIRESLNLKGENVKDITKLTGEEMKAKVKELEDRFTKRFEEMKNAISADFAPAGTVESVFRPDEWKIILPVMRVKGYEVCYDDTIKYNQSSYNSSLFDIDRISTDSPESVRSKIVIVKEIIHELEVKIGKTIPFEEVFKKASEHDITEAEVKELIEKLKRSGDCFEPQRGYIARI